MIIVHINRHINRVRKRGRQARQDHKHSRCVIVYREGSTVDGYIE